ncbi:DUF2779 domain-containing protein [[Mycoplasma] collis]|uniref:DUF2779 domain-containing protein n=1 Tax=[Mycoplasma] collis TaxID=2127 RepID=UPI00051BA095|nr:DUF2779 domain-containing protein [[Mycoplasma] collis]
MKKNEKINYNHFLRYSTMQPYFVWNKINSLDENILDDENSDNLEQLWNFDALLEDDDETENKFIATKSTVYKDITNKFVDDIINEYGINNVYVIKSKTNDQAIIETENIINSKKYRIILFPVFAYKNAIAKIDLLDLKEEKISILKLSTSTKLKDILKVYWNFQITIKNLNLKKCSYFLISTDEFPKKNKFYFDEIFYINLNKTKRKFNPNNASIPISKINFYKKKIEQEGISDKEWNDGDFKDKLIFKIVEKRFFQNKKESFSFENIDLIIENINQYKNIKKLENITNEDNGIFGSNPNINSILEQFYPEIANFSGKILSKNDILQYTQTKDENVIKFLHFLKNTKAKVKLSLENKQALEKLNNKNNKIVWYDFEGFSLPFPPIDGFAPYRQIVFQLSIKQTYKNEIKTKNVVYDPKKINYKVFVEIIEKIFDSNTNYFVVYNKSYENTRLKEMMELIKIYDNEKYNKLLFKYNYIIENTIDLADFFSKYNKKSEIVPSVFFYKLKGFYSIKKIEKLITENKNKLNLKNFIIPYKELKVQNGVMAMSKAIDRYLGLIGDREWEEEKKQLKKYCENDVMAMIMVVDFINWTIQHKDKIKDL